MTENAALTQIERLKKDHPGLDGVVQHRDLQLNPHFQRTIQAQSSYFALLFCDDSVTIESDLGVYDRLSGNVGELQHIHAGEIVLKSYSDEITNAEFLELVLFSPQKQPQTAVVS